MNRKVLTRHAATHTRVWPPLDPTEPIDGLDPKNQRIVEIVYHEAALMESEDPSPPSAEELEDEAALAAFVERLIRQR